MIVLALDTTVPPGSIALWRDSAITSILLDAAASPSVQLPGRVDALLSSASLAAGDVDVFAVATGPGSLTGLRVGIATVQGLAFATSRPVVAVPTLEALAILAALSPETAGTRVIVPWMHAHRGEVFAAVYVAGRAAYDRHDPLDLATIDRKLTQAEGPAVGAPQELLRAWAGALGPAEVTFVGNAVPLTSDVLERSMLHTRLLPGAPLADTVALVAADRAPRGFTISPHAIQPSYVRKPDAVVARERAEARRAGPGVPSIPGD